MVVRIALRTVAGLRILLDGGPGNASAALPWAGAVIARPFCSPSTNPTIRCSAKWQLGSLIHWAKSVLDQGLLLLEQEMKRSGDTRRFEVLGPLLSIQGDDRPREQLARELDMKPVALRVTLMRLRRRYRELLVQVVTDSVGSAEEAGQELELLSAALSGES